MNSRSNRASGVSDDAVMKRAERLGLYGLLAHWEDVGEKEWIEPLLSMEEEERARRSLERRVRNAKLGSFKPMCDFDWAWPRKVEREAVEDLFRFEFLSDAANVILIGPNGVGKTTIAQNLAHQALLRGHTARFVSASTMLGDLAAQDGPSALGRRLRRYVAPALLVVDEVGYLSYSSQHADLLFDIVNRRNGDRSTVVTTNKPFGEWNEVFPNSSSVVALVDRLVHHSEIIEIDGDSYRLKEATERKELQRKRRAAKKKARPAKSKAPK
jgi:DNA replication protein DnaC